MKPLSEQDHYEVLEVPRSASPQEIERAYRMAQRTYSADSLAGYSVMAASDSAVVLERVETAYRVLFDADARAAYDAELEKRNDTLPLDAVSAKPDDGMVPLGDFEADDDEGGEFDGGRLRRARLRRGLEIESLAGITKINPTYLRFIEEERFADLPAPVYVRGFVTAYAQCLGLEGRSVASSYMQRFEAAREEPRRGRRKRGK